MPPRGNQVTYTAAGGVVIDAEGDEVLLLIRPERDEVRLPKGHVEDDETIAETALREVQEESGYTDIEILTNLGEQLVTFPLDGQIVLRTEYYFLMRALTHRRADRPEKDASQFISVWVPWEEAERHLTFEAEKEWARRAREVWERQP
ncbi:MAG: NUDIX hydrolase [Anaerolineae bacterium]